MYNYDRTAAFVAAVSNGARRLLSTPRELLEAEFI